MIMCPHQASTLSTSFVSHLLNRCYGAPSQRPARVPHFGKSKDRLQRHGDPCRHAKVSFLSEGANDKGLSSRDCAARDGGLERPAVFSSMSVGRYRVFMTTVSTGR